MNVFISLLIIFGTVFLVGEHVLARTLETGRAGGYYTHSGKGDRSARARFERFKSRKTPTTRTSITPISVSDQYGNRYRGDLITSTYDPSAKARAGAAAWDKRQSAKAKTIISYRDKYTKRRRNPYRPAYKERQAAEHSAKRERTYGFADKECRSYLIT